MHISFCTIKQAELFTASKHFKFEWQRDFLYDKIILNEKVEIISPGIQILLYSFSSTYVFISDLHLALSCFNIVMFYKQQQHYRTCLRKSN